MKTTVALVGAYAAIASAFTPGRHLHFPRGNGTTTAIPSPADAITTLTVKTTRTSTIISCAPTVTNCPAGKPEMSAIPSSARQIQTVTETIDLITTVCPVSEASAISSKVIESHSKSSVSLTASVPSFNSSALAPTAAPTATPAPVGPVTTLTVKSTRTSTITSCAPTVTNCPAGKPEMSAIPESDRQIKTVTETVDLTTTVCPVSDASSISKKIIESHSSASSALPSQKQPPVKTTDIVSTKTITLTLGTGDKQSVVPTVITTTIKSTITPPASAEQTTTTTRTSTSTKTVTITRAKPTNTPAPSSPGNGGNGNNPSGCEKCAAPATVTVTVAQTTVTASAATVTVTAPCAAGVAPTGVKEVEQPKPSDKNNSSAKPSGNSSQPSAKASSTPCPTDSTTTIEATVTVVPFPVNNGTTPTGTGAPKPSGFASLRR